MSKKTVRIPDNKHPAIYLRVSTDEQAQDGYGLDTQLDLAHKQSYRIASKVAALYVDEGVSGTLTADKRPALSALLTDIDAGLIDTVIVSALDRLARRASLLLNLWDLLELKGVTVLTFKENIDTSTPVGRLMRTMLAAVAEFERDLIVERTTAGRNKRGEEDGDKGGAVPYGYTRGLKGIAVLPDHQPTVKHIFDLRKQGLTLRQIADKLNAEKIASPKGKQWAFRGVKIILDNESKYRGGNRNNSPEKWPTILE